MVETPVLDALERCAGSDCDRLLGGLYASFRSEIGNADITVFHEDCDTSLPYGYRPVKDSPPGGKEGVWVEAHSALFGILNFEPDSPAGFQTGVLLRPRSIGEPYTLEEWPDIVTEVRFVVLWKAMPLPLLPRVLVGAYSDKALGFSDHERTRMGLPTTWNADYALLHQINSAAVRIDGRLIRSVPGPNNPAEHCNLPPYRCIDLSEGETTLRAVLASTCIEPADPSFLSALDPQEANLLERASYSVLTQGPFIARAFIEMLNAPGLNTRRLPRRTPNGRNVQFVCPHYTAEAENADAVV